MTLKLCHQTGTILMSHNISKSQGNQTRKFDQLMKYNERNIFLSKIMPKMRQRD